MKTQRNLLTAFILGLAYLPLLYLLDVTGTSGLFTFIPLFILVLMIAYFASKSLKKGESSIGAVIILLADVLLFALSLLLGGYVNF